MTQSVELGLYYVNKNSEFTMILEKYRRSSEHRFTLDPVKLDVGVLMHGLVEPF